MPWWLEPVLSTLLDAARGFSWVALGYLLLIASAAVGSIAFRGRRADRCLKVLKLLVRARRIEPEP